jgi:hypothetical protein
LEQGRLRRNVSEAHLLKVERLACGRSFHHVLWAIKGLH